MHWPIALVQLFFTLGWTVYVIFLPGLLKQAGIEASWLPWILVVDQLLFAAADLATGLWLDRSLRLLRAAGNILMVLVLAACGVFMLLPYIAQAMPSWLFVAALFVWVVCSSVLRVPPMVLLTKFATPQQPGGMTTPVAAYLFGLGVAGAIAPYLTVVLKNRDPLLPFVLASVALAVATFAWRHQLIKQTAEVVPSGPTARPGMSALTWGLLIAVALFAFGTQIHASVNSAKLFAGVAPGVPLEWLMPLFWGAFSVAMFPASRWLSRDEANAAPADNALWLAGLVGGIALVACATAPPLPLMIALQIIAGAAWAVVFLAALAAVAALGRSGREGTWIGATLALFALATVGRIVLVWALSPGIGGATGSAIAAQLPWASAMLWLLAAALLLSVLRFRQG